MKSIFAALGQWKVNRTSYSCGLFFVFKFRPTTKETNLIWIKQTRGNVDRFAIGSSFFVFCYNFCFSFRLLANHDWFFWVSFGSAIGTTLFGNCLGFSTLSWIKAKNKQTSQTEPKFACKQKFLWEKSIDWLNLVEYV